ncbi:MAG: molybdate ABC transporter substrate-binding protein [Thermodesulfobacteriota bacterium]
MNRFLVFLAMSAAFLLTCALPALFAKEPDRVLVFAAASTTDAVTEICQLFNAKGSTQAVASFASSSTLAKQIENGAPADIFISADFKWMDYLRERGLIVAASRKDLLGNRLVLIAPKDTKLTKVEIEPGFPLVDLLAGGRLSLGDPDHVPAGIYAKQSLEMLGLWPRVESKIARTKDVRAALALVEQGECPLGLVYSTDAAISKKVKVVGIVPENAHPPIIYPAALLSKDARPPVKAFFELLQSPAARAIFEKYGFLVR